MALVEEWIRFPHFQLKTGYSHYQIPPKMEPARSVLKARENDTSRFPVPWTIQTENRIKRLNNSPIEARLKPVTIGCLLFVASVEEFRWYVACLAPSWRGVPPYLSIDNDSTSCTWSSYWTVDSPMRTQLGSQRNWTWQLWIAWHKLHHQDQRQAKREPQCKW